MAWLTYPLFILLVSCPALNTSSDTTHTNQSVSVIYTGNMGVLISNNKTSVWIDGLHQYYGPEYLDTPDSLIQKAFARKDIFNQLQWLLFTHYHRDHFSTQLVKSFLQLADAIKVTGAPQVVDSFPLSNVINAWNRNNEILQDSASSLAIKAFDIPHTWPQRHAKVQNIAYLVEINGIRILHVGDADTDPDAFTRSKIGPVDVMIVPAWFPANEKGRSILQQSGAKKIIVTHIAPGENLKNDFAIGNAEVILFTTINQSTVF